MIDPTFSPPDVTHTPMFFRTLGSLDEADIRYLRGVVRYLLGERTHMPRPYYFRGGICYQIPDRRAELLRILAGSFR
jgi:hypothetical protein